MLTMEGNEQSSSNPYAKGTLCTVESAIVTPRWVRSGYRSTGWARDRSCGAAGADGSLAREDELVADWADELGRLWAWFAEHQFRGYSALYERIAGAASDSPAVLEIQMEAPPEAHLPTVLLGAVHYLLLDGADHPLADVYAGRSNADPVPLFLDLCRARHDELVAVIRVRRVQTNDCGRSALLGPGLTWLSDRLPGSMALVDVGASAGLNLIPDRYRLDYGGHGTTGPPSPVSIHCDVIGGEPPIAAALPSFAVRVGLDRSPIDLADPDDARWLLACVWPDTGRLERTAASIRLARESLPAVHPGDAVHDLPPLLEGLDEGVSAVVVNTWSLSYLSRAEREEYVDVLAQASRRRVIGWLLADDSSVLSEVPALGDGGPAGNALAALLFDRGELVSGEVLAAVHQHGVWIDWRATSSA
jgi:hypothetical protein